MKPCLAITALIGSNLIVHEFESEDEALRIAPYIKRWNREDWDKRYSARYHSAKAIRFWKEYHEEQMKSKKYFGFRSTRIIHKGKEKTIIYQ